MYKTTPWILVLNFIAIILYPANGQDAQATVLYWATKTEVTQISLQTQNEQTLHTGQHIVGLAADLADNYLFWTDLSSPSQNGGIWRSRINTPEKIVAGDAVGVAQPTGLAVDWVNKLLYWTDPGQRTVEISDYNGGKRRTIIMHGLSIPRGIISDPINGYLYIGDQGTHQILRCKLDGKQCTVWKSATDSEAVYWPNQLSINYNTRRLYWTDGWNNSVSSCNFDGTGCTSDRVASSGALFGLSTVSGQVYYSTLNNRTLSSLDNTGQSSVLSSTRNSRSYFMVSSDRSTTQPPGNSPCNGHSCTDLCVPHDNVTYFCACPSYSAKVLVDDRTCQSTDEFLVYADTENGEVGMMAIPSAAVNASGHPTTLIARATHPVAVTYDTHSSELFFSDLEAGSIVKVSLDGTGRMEILNRSHGVDQVEGLALDAKQRRLYFSNRGYMDDNGVAFWHKIEFYDLDNKQRRTVVTDVSKPRGLFIDSEARYLYYTDWGTNQVVGRTNLDGFQKVDILTINIPGGLERPNGITIINNKLYAVDSKVNFNGRYTFIRSNVDGTGPREVQISTSMMFPFGVTGNAQRLYITNADSGNSKLITYVISTGQTSEVNYGFKKLTGIQFVKKSVSTPPDNGVCAGNTNPCQNAVCVTKSGSQSSTCLCQSNRLNYLAEDRKTCSAPSNYILAADVDGIKMAPLESSSDPHVYTLVPGTQTCGNFKGLAVDQKKKRIYFSRSDSGVIYRANLDGTNMEELDVEHDTRIVHLSYAAGYIFWTGLYGCNDTEGGVFSWEIDSTNKQAMEIKANISDPNAIVASGRYVYWSERTSQISYYDWVNKTHPATVDIRHGSNVESLGVDDKGHLYVSYSNGELAVRKFPTKPYRIDLQFSEGYLGAASGVFLSGKYVYLTTNKVIQFDRLTKLNVTEVDTGLLYRPGQIVVITDEDTGQQIDDKLGTCGGIQVGACSQLECNGDATCPGKEKCCYSQISFQCSICEEPRDTNLCTLNVAGTSVSWSRDQGKYQFDCMECDCNNPVCVRIACPSLPCPVEEQETVGCCPVCTTIKQCTDKPSIEGCPSAIKEVTLAANMSYVHLDMDLLSIENMKAYSCDNQPVPLSELTPDQVKWSANLQKIVTSAEDKHGKTTCEISLKVKDVTAPLFTYCPTGSIDKVTQSNEVNVEWQMPTATDNSGFDPEITLGGNQYKNGDLFPVGVREVIYTATDGAGNRAECKFSVNVIKEEFKCPDPPVIQNGYLQCRTSSGVTRCFIEKCHRGYLLLDDNNQTYSCQGDNVWQPAFPDLFGVKSCFKPEPLEVELQFVVALISCPNAEFTENDVLNCLSDTHVCPPADSGLSICENDRLTLSRGENYVTLLWNSLALLEFGQDYDELRNEIFTANTRVVLFFQQGTYRQSCPRITCNVDADKTRTDTEPTKKCPYGSKLHKLRGQDVCAPCSPGTRYSETNENCEKCHKGTYQIEAGRSYCNSCLPGYTSEEASFLKTHCILELEATTDPQTQVPVVPIVVGVLVPLVIIIIVLSVLFCYCRRQSEKHKENALTRGYEKTGFEPPGRMSEYYDQLNEAADTYHEIPADSVAPLPPDRDQTNIGNDGYVTPKTVSDAKILTADPYIELGDTKTEKVDYQGLISPYEKLGNTREGHEETYTNPLFQKEM